MSLKVSNVANPSASSISVAETLELLDGPFAELANGVGRCRYAFWLGSGISRDRVDDLKRVVRRVLSFLQTRIVTGDPDCRFRAALLQAIDFAELSEPEREGVDLDQSIDDWESLDIILQRLIGKYSRVLDIRVSGEQDDYLLWEAVDVPATYPADAEPDCEHICLALLALEGCIPDLVSGNWDGLIEAAIRELAAGRSDILHICVRSEDFRDPPSRARLLKFHGCAIRAASKPEYYRPMLIARHSQITDWRYNNSYGVMRRNLVDLAVSKPTLMIGLSAQDTNIQDIFAEAQATMQWPWPCNPPAYVFAEDALGNDQRNLLRCVYRQAYTDHMAEIEASALLRAFAKPLLVALVIHVVCAKFQKLASLADAPKLGVADRTAVDAGICRLRNIVAELVGSDRLQFIRALINHGACAMSIFRLGRQPDPASTEYWAIGAMPVHQIANEPNLAISGLREMAVCLGLLGLGEDNGWWKIALGDPTDLSAGILQITSSAGPARLFFVANDGAALHLANNGIVSEGDGDVIALYSVAPLARRSRSVSAAPGRTGRRTARGVGISGLLDESDSIDALCQRFRELAVL